MFLTFAFFGNQIYNIQGIFNPVTDKQFIMNLFYFCYAIVIGVFIFLSYKCGGDGKKPADIYVFTASILLWVRLLIRMFDFEETK